MRTPRDRGPIRRPWRRPRRRGRPGDRRSRCGHTRGPAAGGSRSPSTIPDGGTSAGPRSCGRWCVPRCGRVARPRRSGAARLRPGPLWRAGRRRERGVETSARRDSYGAARVTSRRTRSSSSSSGSSVRPTSPSPSISSSVNCRFSVSISSIFSSMVPLVTNLRTSTLRCWPWRGRVRACGSRRGERRVGGHGSRAAGAARESARVPERRRARKG